MWPLIKSFKIPIPVRIASAKSLTPRASNVHTCKNCLSQELQISIPVRIASARKRARIKRLSTMGESRLLLKRPGRVAARRPPGRPAGRPPVRRAIRSDSSSSAGEHIAACTHLAEHFPVGSHPQPSISAPRWFYVLLLGM